MTAGRRAFILRQTRLQTPPLVPELRLHLADAITPLWQRTAQAQNQGEAPPPYWAVAWAGGQALARYVLDHPATVAGRRVLDIATGSGLCAIAALTSGAATVQAADIDEYCVEAVALNAAANGVTMDFTARDMLAEPPPAADLILAGDVFYEQPLAGRMLRWLHMAHAGGARVLMGDPERAYAPRAGVLRLATYDVPTSGDVEGTVLKRAAVFTFST